MGSRRCDVTPLLAGRLIEGAAAGYRANRRLLRALLIYARSHDGSGFQRRAEADTDPRLIEVTRMFLNYLGVASDTRVA